MLRRVFGWVSAVACGFTLVTVAPVLAQGDEQTPTGGVFVPVAPSRVFDWAGDPAKRVMPGSPKPVQVTGVSGVPASGVTAVVVDVTASSSTGVTNVYVKRSAEEATAAMLTVGHTTGSSTNTVIVEPAADGTVFLASNAQPLGVNLDVQGYFTTEGAAGQVGGFVPVTPERMVSSVNGLGVRAGKLTAGTVTKAQIGGVGEIPADATAVFANVRFANATAGGSAWVQAAGSTMTASAMSYASGLPADMGMTIKLGEGGADAGKVALKIGAGNADVIIDVQGYFTGTEGDGGGFTSVVQARLYDTRANPEGDLQPGEKRVISVAGLTGVPDDGSAGAVAVTISAANWTANGSLSVYNSDYDTNNGVSNVAWTGAYAAQPEYSTSIVEISDDGTITLQNNSGGTVRIILATQGWFSVDNPSLEPVGLDPNLEVVEEIAGQSSQIATFTPPVDAAYTLQSGSGGKVVLQVDGQQIGYYKSQAVDNEGGLVPHTLQTDGTNLSITLDLDGVVSYPVTFGPMFTSIDPADPVTQELYEALRAAAPGAPSPAETVQVANDAASASLAELLDDGGEDLTQFTNAGMTGSSSLSALSSGEPRKIKVPKKKNSNGNAIASKFYYYDPSGDNPREGRNWRKGWHDYCTKSLDAPGFTTAFTPAPRSRAISTRVTFKGPCARHDLCIEFKQAPDRMYCDSQFKVDLRQNCRHFLYPFNTVQKKKARARCLRRADTYHRFVKNTTEGYFDAGHWGHSGESVYPTYNWYTW